MQLNRILNVPGHRTCCRTWPAPSGLHGSPPLSTAPGGSADPAGCGISLGTAYLCDLASAAQLQTTSLCRSGLQDRQAGGPPAPTRAVSGHLENMPQCARSACSGNTISVVLGPERLAQGDRVQLHVFGMREQDGSPECNTSRVHRRVYGRSAPPSSSW